MLFDRFIFQFERLVLGVLLIHKRLLFEILVDTQAPYASVRNACALGVSTRAVHSLRK